MNSVSRYLKESWAEIAKVAWPTRPQAIRLTVAVIGLSIVLAAFIGALDYGYNQALQKLIFKS